MSDVFLKITGEVERSLALSFADLAGLDSASQVIDVSRLDAKRSGDAVTLAGLLALAGAKPSAQYLTLHSATDDFHASIPLDAVRERGILIYRSAGGAVASARQADLFASSFPILPPATLPKLMNARMLKIRRPYRTPPSQRGHDNRPLEEREHAELHRRQEEIQRQEQAAKHQAAAGELTDK